MIAPEPARPLDARRLLTTYLVLLLGFPAALIIGPLGGAGTPATLLGIGALLLWCAYHLHRRESWTEHRQPVRTAGLLFLLVMLLVYAHAMTRPIAAEEISTADGAMLRVLGLVGILVVANDGAASYSTFHVVLRRLALGGGALGTLALVQFLTGQLLVDRISLPGLVWNSQLNSLGRNGFYRVTATATHSIELGVVIAMILPVVVTLVLHTTGRRRWGYMAVAVVMALALFLTISRSALMSAAVAVAFMFPVWSRPVRRTVLASGLVMVTLVYLSVPGLLGTIEQLFVGIDSDPSALSRSNAYSIAFEFVGRSPLLGRGLATFLPPYIILDNEYLLILIEGGVLGLLALVGLLVTGVLVARRSRLLAMTELDRHAMQAVGASVAAGACGALFFDGFSFPIVVGVLFLDLGLCGAGWELARRGAVERVPVVAERARAR